ncbi:MAG: flagellar hook-length control protein FliK [Peptococcaceae bacterium]|nr:flagellar hook-length control protein FliK [Peptococcaceae bacterium]
MVAEVAATAAEKAGARGPGPVRAAREGMAEAETSVPFDFLLALMAATAPEDTAGLPARGETPPGGSVFSDAWPGVMAEEPPGGLGTAGSGGEYAAAGGWPGLRAVWGVIDPAILPEEAPTAATGSGTAPGEVFPVQGQAIPGQAGNEGPGSGPAAGEMAADTGLTFQGLVQPLNGRKNAAAHPGIASGPAERPGEGDGPPGGLRPWAEEGGLTSAGDMAGRDRQAVVRDSPRDYGFRFRMAVDQVRAPGSGQSLPAEATVRQSGEAAAAGLVENAQKGAVQGTGPGSATPVLPDAAGEQVLRPVTADQAGKDGDGPETVITGTAAAGRNAAGTSGADSEGRGEARPGEGNAGKDGEIPVAVGLDARPGASGNTAATLTNIFQGRFSSAVLPHVIGTLRNMTADQARVTVIKLKLEPENLGEIKIRLAYSKGELTAHFFTSSGLVKDAVECSLPQLREALAQHSVSLGEAAAFVGQEQQGQRWADLGGSGYRYREIPSGASGEYPGEPVRTVHAGENGRSLDLFI